MRRRQTHMLDQVLIFSKTGLVLWSQSWASLKGDPVNSVIHQVLLEVCGHFVLPSPEKDGRRPSRRTPPPPLTARVGCLHARSRASRHVTGMSAGPCGE